MPQINRQRPTTSPTRISRSGSIWDKRLGAGQGEERKQVLAVYGRNGAGKTWFACTFPKPLLLLGCEDGRDTIANVEGVEFLPIDHTDELHQIATDLAAGNTFAREPPYEGQPYQTVVLDSTTSLQDLVLKELMGWDEVPVQLAWGIVKDKGYQQRAEKTKELLRKIIDLKQLHRVIIAHEKNHTDKEEEGGGGSLDAEILKPFIGPSLGKSTANWLCETVNHVCQAFTREEYVEKVHVVAKIKTTTREKTGKIDFCLRTAKGHPFYAAKIRADRRIEVPDVITDPSYEKFMAAISGTE